MKRTVKAPTGKELTCKNRLSEAVYRIIQNNLDAEFQRDISQKRYYSDDGCRNHRRAVHQFSLLS